GHRFPRTSQSTCPNGCKLRPTGSGSKLSASNAKQLINFTSKSHQAFENRALSTRAPGRLSFAKGYPVEYGSTVYRSPLCVNDTRARLAIASQRSLLLIDGYGCFAL